MLTPEEIQANFEKFRELCSSVENRSTALLAFIDHFSERLALCPASSRKSYHRSIPGGLVEHSLRVLKNAMRLNKAFNWNLDKNSLVVACLMHDIGKLGGLDDEYYIKAEGWQNQKHGNLYQTNQELAYMQVPHRSIFLLQHFGVSLNHDEYLAITLNDGFVVEANKDYCLKEPRLATCIWMADYIATIDEKTEEHALHAKEEADKKQTSKANNSETKD